MLRSLHMKLVMIMALLILSLMTVVGTFLINSVMAFYLEEFYAQMYRVFNQDPTLSRNLETEVSAEEDGAQAILRILEAYYGDLGLDGRSRTLYILDGETGAYLAGTDEEEGRNLEYNSPNLTRALVERSEGARPISRPTIWMWPSPSPGETANMSSIFWTIRPRLTA